MKKFVVLAIGLTLSLSLAWTVYNPFRLDSPGHWEFDSSQTSCAYRQCHQSPANKARFKARTGEAVSIGKGKERARVDVTTYKEAMLCEQHMQCMQDKSWPSSGWAGADRWFSFLCTLVVSGCLFIGVPMGLLTSKRPEPPGNDGPLLQ